MNAIAGEFARKLVFTPARKNGKPVPSETSLTLVVDLQPAGAGRFAPKLDYKAPDLVAPVAK